MIEVIYFTLSMSFIFLSMLGYGLLIYKDQGKHDLFFIILTGYFSLGFLALLIHFFFPISDILSIIILSLGLLFLVIRMKYLNDLKIFKKIIIFILFCFILIGFSEHPIDTNMYHHPYVSYLNSEKIIFGVAQIQFRFGHVSFLQYVQAVTSNKFIHELTIASPNLILFSFFIFYCSDIILKKYNKKLLFLITILLSSFILIKISRYREFGNDLIPFLVASYLLINIFEQVFYKNLNRLRIIILSPIYATFIFAHKISYLFSALIFITILEKNDLMKIIKSKYTFVIFLIFSSFWISKNVITTSCLAYPLVMSCLENTSWYLSGMADPKNASWLTELWAKDFITNKNWKNINLTEYMHSFQWVPNWLNNHFIKILEKISPLIIVCILIISFLLTKKKDFHNINQKENKKLFLLLLSVFVGLTIWFLKAPIFRYGSFYIVSFISIIFIFFIQDIVQKVKINEFKKLKTIFIISVVFFVCKNIDRQIKSNDNFFTQTRINIVEYSEVGNNELRILKPKTIGLCYYSGFICSHEVNEGIIYNKSYGYFFLNKNN